MRHITASRRGMGAPGFTLLELMIVLSIIGILATIAIPNYIKMQPHLRLKAAARDSASAMQIARMTAISRNTKTRVLFDLDTDKFVIQTFVSGAWETASNATAKSDGWLDIELYDETGYTDELSLLDGDITDSGELGAVVFRPDGSANMGPDKQALYIKNKKETGEVYRVLVRSITGLVTVQKKVGGAWK